MSGGGCPRQLKKIELHAVCGGDSLFTVTQKAQHIGVQFDARMTMEYVARDSGVQFCYCQPTEYNARIRRYPTRGPTSMRLSPDLTLVMRCYKDCLTNKFNSCRESRTGRPARWIAPRNSATRLHFSSSCIILLTDQVEQLDRQQVIH